MNVTPLTTNRAEASKIILAGHAARTLPAQNGMNSTYFSLTYKGKVCRCAIGQLYPEAEARELEGNGFEGEATNYPMVRALMDRGLLIVPDNEQQWFIDIQDAHDDWSLYAGFEGEDVYERWFLDLLQ